MCSIFIIFTNSVLNKNPQRRSKCWRTNQFDGCTAGSKSADTPMSGSDSSGGGENGSSSHFCRSIFVKVFRRSEDTRLEKCQSYFAVCRRYDISNMVMRAVQIWISTALREVPTKLFMCRFCFRLRKKISIIQRDLYSWAMVLAAQEKLFVSSSTT